MSSDTSSVIGHFFYESSAGSDCRKQIFFQFECLERNNCTAGRNKRNWPAQSISMFSQAEIKPLIFPQPCGPCSTCLLFFFSTPSTLHFHSICVSASHETADRNRTFLLGVKVSRSIQRRICLCSVDSQSSVDSVSLLPCQGLSLFFVCVHARTSVTVFVRFDCAQVCVGMHMLQCQSVAFLLGSLFHYLCSTILFFVGSFL